MQKPKIMLLLVFNIVIALKCINAIEAIGDPITNSDLQCLSELPVLQLLKIKKSLQEMTNLVTEDSNVNINSDRIGGYVAETDTSDGYVFDNYRNDSVLALPLTSSNRIQ